MRPIDRSPPIIAWHDPGGDVDAIRREIGAETFQRTIGMPLVAQLSLAKILWLRQHVPQTRRAVRFLSVPSGSFWPGRIAGQRAVAGQPHGSAGRRLNQTV